jgi:hypothetical protein
MGTADASESRPVSAIDPPENNARAGWQQADFRGENHRGRFNL